MQNPEFEKKLKEIVDQKDDAFQKAQDDLESLRQGIETAVFSETKAKLKLVPGFRNNFGQQINVVVSAPDGEHTLFRCYVPETGYPMRMDFYGEDLVPVDDGKELQEQVLKFMNGPEAKTTLATLRRYAV